MIKPAEIDPTVLAQSVLGLLMRSGRRRADGLGRTVEVEQESGETIQIKFLRARRRSECGTNSRNL